MGSKSLALFDWGSRWFSNKEGKSMNTRLCVVSLHHAHLEVKSSNCKSTITYNNFRHCHVSFSSFVRQPYSKQLYTPEARFTRRISAVSSAIQTKDNKSNHLIIYCLNCIRHGKNAMYEQGLIIPKQDAYLREIGLLFWHMQQWTAEFWHDEISVVF